MMRRDLELARLLVWSLNRSDLPVISRQVVSRTEREDRFQVHLASAPVDLVVKLDAVTSVACRQADVLNERRAFGLPLHTQGHPSCAILGDADPWRSAHEASRRTLFVGKI